MSHADIQPMAKTVLVETELFILVEYAGTRVERHQEMTIEKNAEQFPTHANIVRKLRWQHWSLTQ